MPTFADAYISSLANCRLTFFSKTTASSRAKRARENERGGRERKIPHHYPLALAVNKSPAVHILSPNGLWRENRGSVNRLRKYSQVCVSELAVFAPVNWFHLYFLRVSYLRHRAEAIKVSLHAPAYMHPMKQLHKRHTIAAKIGAWINFQQESPKGQNNSPSSSFSVAANATFSKTCSQMLYCFCFH